MKPHSCSVLSVSETPKTTCRFLKRIESLRVPCVWHRCSACSPSRQSAASLASVGSRSDSPQSVCYPPHSLHSDLSRPMLKRLRRAPVVSCQKHRLFSSRPVVTMRNGRGFSYYANFTPCAEQKQAWRYIIQQRRITGSLLHKPEER